MPQKRKGPACSSWSNSDGTAPASREQSSSSSREGSWGGPQLCPSKEPERPARAVTSQWTTRFKDDGPAPNRSQGPCFTGAPRSPSSSSRAPARNWLFRWPVLRKAGLPIEPWYINGLFAAGLPGRRRPCGAPAGRVIRYRLAVPRGGDPNVIGGVSAQVECSCAALVSAVPDRDAPREGRGVGTVRENAGVH